jgi:PAS domain S-box-containing protein
VSVPRFDATAFGVPRADTAASRPRGVWARLEALALRGADRTDGAVVRRVRGILLVALLGMGAGSLYLLASLFVSVAPSDRAGAVAAVLVCATTLALGSLGRIGAAAWTVFCGCLAICTSSLFLSGSADWRPNVLVVLVMATALFGRRGLLVAGALTLVTVLACSAAIALGLATFRSRSLGEALVVGFIEVALPVAILVWHRRAEDDLLADLRRRNADADAANRAVEESRRAIAQLVDESPDAILTLRGDGAIELVNPTFERLTGREASAVKDRHLEQTGLLAPAAVSTLRTALGEALAGRPGRPFELDLDRGDGSTVPVEINLRPVHRKAGPALVQATIRDVTERRQADKARVHLENELRQAQRVDALGRLAGGIAHDFNNLLTVILTSAAVLKLRFPSAEPQDDLQAIEGSAQKAAELTRQLLAFSRKQVQRPRVLDLGQCVEGTQKLLRRLLPEEIRVVFRRGPTPIRVKADPGQIEQVVINLAVNARDAMPNGGTLTISTSEGSIEPALGTSGPVTRCAILRVTDNGLGMDEATCERVFEPFFTTKPFGQGTGLGLATVHGIVTQSGGTIRVESEPGRGATFEIRLPLSEEAETALTEGPKTPDELRGHETILLVEDDAAVRETTHKALGALGYRVLVAADANDALAMAMAASPGIDLLITDVVMPGASGPDLAARLRSFYPVRVLFMSGYADEAVRKNGVRDQAAFLQKPFTPVQLGRRVRNVLDAARVHSQA